MRKLTLAVVTVIAAMAAMTSSAHAQWGYISDVRDADTNELCPDIAWNDGLVGGCELDMGTAAVVVAPSVECDVNLSDLRIGPDGYAVVGGSLVEPDSYCWLDECDPYWEGFILPYEGEYILGLGACMESPGNVHLEESLVLDIGQTPGGALELVNNHVCCSIHPLFGPRQLEGGSWEEQNGKNISLPALP